jgi:hypothetical protein
MSIISKELLSEVLKDVDFMYGISDIYICNNVLQVSYYETDIKCMCGCYEINIHELANKCKKWAYEQRECTIVSYCGGVEVEDKDDTVIHLILNKEATLIKFNPLYDIKACQWILDNDTN